MHRKTLITGAVGSLLATSAYSAGPSEPADLARFLQSAINAAHIAAAMATVNAWGCDNPFTFSQEEGGRSEDAVMLSINCDNAYDGYSMQVFFRETEDGLQFTDMGPIP